MVTVTPHYFHTRDLENLLGLRSYGKVLNLYSIGDRGAGYTALGRSWVLDDRPHRGVDIYADPDEVTRWTQAQHAAETELRDAEARLITDQGWMEEVYDSGARTLGPAPGWRALARQLRPGRRRRACARFRKSVDRIDAEYQPIRKQITTRLPDVQPTRSHRAQAVPRRDALDRSGRTIHVSAHTSFGIGGHF